MKITPELLDAATIQLRGVFLTGEDIPADVKETGEPFLDALDRWAAAQRAAQEKVAAK